jgi:hypothetical protein
MDDASWLSRHRSKKLHEHGGRTAVATVLEFNKHFGITEDGYGGVPMGQVQWYKLKVRVEPADEPAFEAEFSERRYDDGATFPHEGMKVAVIYDPDDHSHVARDTSQEGQSAEWDANTVRTAPAVTAPAPAAGRDVAAQLKDLADLHDRGVLSDAELAAAKAKVLGD